MNRGFGEGNKFFFDGRMRGCWVGSVAVIVATVVGIIIWVGIRIIIRIFKRIFKTFGLGLGMGNRWMWNRMGNDVDIRHLNRGFIGDRVRQGSTEILFLLFCIVGFFDRGLRFGIMWRDRENFPAFVQLGVQFGVLILQKKEGICVVLITFSILFM
jgi:hypothetical protein